MYINIYDEVKEITRDLVAIPSIVRERDGETNCEQRVEKTGYDSRRLVCVCCLGTSLHGQSEPEAKTLREQSGELYRKRGGNRNAEGRTEVCR